MRNNIRLADNDLKQLKTLFQKHFATNDTLWIFGSRTDAKKRGGDIDLYIETHAKNPEEALKMKTNFIWALEQALGEQKIDIVLNILILDTKLPIYQIAKLEGIQLV